MFERFVVRKRENVWFCNVKERGEREGKREKTGRRRSYLETGGGLLAFGFSPQHHTHIAENPFVIHPIINRISLQERGLYSIILPKIRKNYINTQF